jgi:hypothetical protein
MSSKTIRIDVKSSHQAFLLKDELLAAGLVWQKDFTWRYNPAKSGWDYDLDVPARVEFTFRDGQLATYYRMKWV